MSETAATARTNAFEDSILGKMPDPKDADKIVRVVGDGSYSRMVGFARTLERELTAALDRLGKMEMALKPFADYFDGDLKGVGGGTFATAIMKIQSFKDAKLALTKKTKGDGT